MQPGKRSALALANSSGDIQRPKLLVPAPRGRGAALRCSCVTITVLLSTRATSRGSVRANQLQVATGRGTGCYFYRANGDASHARKN